MNCFKSIINGKEALQQVQINDLAISLDDNQLKQLQMVLFEMYQDILSVCKEAGLTPFLVGGSALGAVRHQGFIPWDDDLDMAMKRNEYNQLINRLQEKFTDKYIVSSPGKGENSCARFTKVFKKNTVFKGLFPARNDQFNGVFVDIFPIENIPDRWCIRILKGIICDIIAYISSQVYNRENNSATSGVALKRTGLFNYHVRMIVGFLFSFHKSSWWFHLFDQFSQSRESASRYSSIPSGRKHFFGEILKDEDIYPPRYVKFNDILVPVFNNVEVYLTILYGNFLKIPEENKRERHYITEIKL